MNEFETELATASQALDRLVEGPGLAAADALEQAFGRAGQSIERALSQAARSGELDFKQMAESVLADLARIAAEAVIARTSAGQTGQTVNLNMAVNPGADQSGIVGAAGSIANAVARATARGGRYI